MFTFIVINFKYNNKKRTVLPKGKGCSYVNSKLLQNQRRIKGKSPQFLVKIDKVLPFRVRLFMDVPQLSNGVMSVHLCRSKTAVSQQLFYRI
jgi:hypothetical protein